MGPKITVQPENTILVAGSTIGILECASTGNPQPTFRWFRGSFSLVEIGPGTDSRYTFINGRLIIDDPVEESDANTYIVLVENEFGSIYSNPANIIFGTLGEFSNDKPGQVVATAHQGVRIECNPPPFKPAVLYSWFKDIPPDFIRPDFYTHFFLSNNGNMYISEVTRVDISTYHCIVKLTSSSNSDIATTQPPSRTSLGVDLTVIEQAAANWGPLIHDDFPAIFPSTPLVGNDVRIECLAYGTLPMVYSWERVTLPMPEKVHFADQNRVMLIPNIQLEDAGDYRCNVMRTSFATDNKILSVRVSSKPIFTFPLKDQHVDAGGDLNWRCDAQAIPTAKYAWLKNGKPLVPIPGQIDVLHNIMVIRSLNADRDNGMYQCSATNLHGTTYSGAQVRVLSFQPTFKKNPLDVQQIAALSGDVTIICEPEAAPVPRYTWAKNGIQMNLPDADTTSRVQKLRNGNLFITDLTHSDAGSYTCTATNNLGAASSTGLLTIQSATAISRGPSPTSVNVNETAFLYCDASYARGIDMVYSWKFNFHDIDFDRHPYFVLGSINNPGGLYIRTAQIEHAGTYQCIADTINDNARHSAVLTVKGPPGEPSGVFVEIASITKESMRIRWTSGADNGQPIMFYLVEASTLFNPDWIVVGFDIRDTSTIVPGETKRATTLTGLKPWNSYSFRLRAINLLGIGPASLPSALYNTPEAAPVIPPRNVSGGGGSVGDLAITWEPLPPVDHGGAGIGYYVYWRKVEMQDIEWIKETVTDPAKFGRHVITVGQEMHYLPYETKVQAFNKLDKGPNSTIGGIYSAEDLPLAVPEYIILEPINATAMIVRWEPVSNTREFMKGTVMGYQVNYWIRYEPRAMVHSISFLGQRSSGLIIGLFPNTQYVVNVMVFNTAGLGHNSEDTYQRTYMLPPQLYPTEVHVYSHGPNSVSVRWRGVSTNDMEESLQGYILRYYKTSENIREALDVSTTKITRGILFGIERDVIYQLRVLGTSLGGDGKLSPTTYFTLGGLVIYDPTTSDIIAGGVVLLPSLLLYLITLIVCMSIQLL